MLPQPAQASPIVFMFPGQGAQYPDMGAGLYATEAVFRDAVDQCASVLAPHLGLDLRTLLYPKTDRESAAKALMSTLAAQPAIFTIEYATAQLWLSRGIAPSAMIGHSIGEFVAATLAGVMTLDDALAIVAARGRLMGELPGGAMLSVRLPAAKVIERLPTELSLAADKKGIWSLPWLQRLGDASYAIYLGHTLTAPAVAKLCLGNPWLFVPLDVAVGIGTGLVGHSLVESP